MSTYSLRTLYIILLTATCNIQTGNDTIITTNETDSLLYVTTYTLSKKNVATRSGSIYPLKAGETRPIDKPKTGFFDINTSVVVASTSKTSLPEEQQAPNPLYAVALQGTLGEPRTSAVIFNTLGKSISGSAPNRNKTITVLNTTDQPVFVCIYFDDGRTALRWSKPVTIPPQEKVALIRPERKCTVHETLLCTKPLDRTILMSFNQSDLAEEVPSGRLPSCNVGSLRGDLFSVYTNAEGRLDGTFETHYKIVKAIDTVTSILKPDIEKAMSAIAKRPYPGKNQIAKVERNANSVSPQEQRAVQKRKNKHVRAACARLYMEVYGKPLPPETPIPTIGIALSGGGTRAMIASTAFLAQCEKTGLLHLVSHIAALSGSTWALAGWQVSQQTAQDYYHACLDRMRSGILRNFNLEQIQQMALSLKGFSPDTPETVVSIYGALLGDKLLTPYAPHGNQNFLFFGEPTHLIDAGDMPYPLYTAVAPSKYSDAIYSDDPKRHYVWLIFTPHTVYIEGPQNGCISIPAYGIGRTYHNDQSITISPPLPWGFLLGIWGSAMSVNLREVGSVVLNSFAPDTARDMLTFIAGNETLSLLVQQRHSPAQLPNFAAEGNITIVDGGMRLILPVTPYLDTSRKTDIIITLDASSAVRMAPSIVNIKAYAEDHAIYLPSLDLKTIGKQACTVAWDKEKGPMIIHNPLIADPAYQKGWDPETALFTFTGNFTYSKSEAELLCGLVEYNLSRSVETIRKAVADWLHAHIPQMSSTAP